MLLACKYEIIPDEVVSPINTWKFDSVEIELDVNHKDFNYILDDCQFKLSNILTDADFVSEDTIRLIGMEYLNNKPLTEDRIKEIISILSLRVENRLSELNYPVLYDIKYYFGTDDLKSNTLIKKEILI